MNYSATSPAIRCMLVMMRTPTVSLLLTLAAAAFLAGTMWAQQAAPPQGQTSQKPAAAPSPSSTAQEDAAQSEEARLPPTNDPKEIVRRATEVDHHNFEKAQKYTCTQRQVVKELDKHGNVKSTEVKTYDINFYYGEFYSKLVQIDDKPLNEKDQKKEDQKLEKFLAKRRNESESDREKRSEKDKKEREEGRAFVRDVQNAYDFRLVGEEQVSGTDTWVIEATPRKDFKPTQPHADILKKIKGRMWIEKKDYNWVKVEAEAVDTISFGLFLFRIHPGSRFVLETAHINNELWAMKRLYINGSARIAIFKNESAEQEDIFSNFKKFTSSVTILPGVKEVPEEKPQPK
jgi:Ni/Co efflux regulator RcnB